jgi:hypothetical protein
VTEDAAGIDDADRRAIELLIVEFAWRVDHDRADTVHSLFVENGRLVLGPHHLDGDSAIAEWGANRAGQERRSMHVCSNIRITSPGPDLATATTYAVIYMADRGGPVPGSPLSVGEYHDEFARRTDGWRFTQREMVMLANR